MHLLLGCVDLLSTTGKMVSDGMLLMQKDPTLGIPTLHKFLGILLEIVAIRLSLGNFWKPNLPGRYSAVIMIPLDNANSQISLEMAIIPLFCVPLPPLFISYERALIFSTWKWIDLRSNIFEKVKKASLMANTSRTLIWSFDSWRDH